ncbi:MAG: hypothetical protein QUV05_08570 [Phycisphaerae bacterium]|jgi:hypothetical protein|nr:hypothetical protein [Phycisphaerae bacterium]
MPSKVTSVYTFKVALAGRKSIWRRIAVRGNQTLDQPLFIEAFLLWLDNPRAASGLCLPAGRRSVGSREHSV